MKRFRGWILSMFVFSQVVGMPALVRAAIINVSNNTQLSSALSTVNPGDEIVLANGTYSGFTITRSGNASARILIRAANSLGATVNSGNIRFNNGVSYVTVQGLNITTAGTSQTVDDRTGTKLAVWFEAAKNCRLTRCKLVLSGHTGETEWVMLSGNSLFNRVDHCEFGPNTVDSHLIWPRGNSNIPGVTYNPTTDRATWANGGGPYNPNMARQTLIDHNYFHDHMPDVSNGGECLVLGAFGGTGDYQDTGTVIEYNMFQNVFGDGELMSSKSSVNTFRYNTLRSCGGGPVSRSGNKVHIYGNFLLQASRTGSSGFRIHEMDHLVYNNYVESALGSAVSVGDGDPYNDAGFSHAQVVRAKIFNNTFVNCGAFDTGNAHPLDPINLVIANNLLFNTTETISDPPLAGWTYSQNIIWPSTGPTGFLNVNPLLTTVNSIQKLASGSPAIDAANTSLYPFLSDDMDGQDRIDADIGADEFSTGGILRRPLTTADVGTASPDGVISTEYEAERLFRATNGATVSVTQEDAASRVFWIALNADAAGDWIEFTLPNVPAGNYDLLFEYKVNTTRGTLNATLDGVSIGTIDQYAAAGAFVEADLGAVTFANDGSHTLRLTVTGKNAASTGFGLSADRFNLVPVTVVPVATPTFSPPPGTFPDPVFVTISTTTGGASIRYTTDGSTPTSTTGTLYGGPILISVNTTLKAIAFNGTQPDSAVATGVYVILTAPPTFNPPAGTYTNPVSVAISSTTSGATIRYTTDGSTPTSSSGTIYTNPVSISVTTTLKAIAFKSGMGDSPVTTGVYTINLSQVAPPTFNPPAGTYTNPVSVAISSTTSGATIRYTTDGSTPTSSSGTIYTNPVSISVTTTLKAIAFKSGMGDSTVTSGLYTINTGGGTTVSFEAETLAFTTNGATAALQNDVNTSGGTWLALNADGAGDWIQFTLPNITAGTYQVKLSYKQHVNRGILQASANGSNFGGTLDQYSATTAYPEVILGTVTFSATGNQTLRLTCTGKTAASGAFTLSADKITLVSTSGPPPTVLIEAESMPVTSSGATTSTANDAGASGGVWLALNAANAGPFMDLTTPVLQPGTYQVQFTYKSNTTRGQHTVTVDGVQVGGTIDQYATTQTFPTVTLGNVTFSSAATHVIRLTVTGKNAASSNFILAADKFTFVGQ